MEEEPLDAAASARAARWMADRRPMKLSTYVIGAVVVWVAIILASGVILAGTTYVGTILPILSGGATWFVVIVPAATRRRQHDDHPRSAA
jgi:hypothetical protein